MRGVPLLPIAKSILKALYSFSLFVPVASIYAGGVAGAIYAVISILATVRFVQLAWKLWRAPDVGIHGHV